MKMSEFHESPWAGHRGTWETFEKLKEKYWWLSMYKDVVALLCACVEKGGTTGVLDLEEMETRHRTSLARRCWAWLEPEDLRREL